MLEILTRNLFPPLISASFYFDTTGPQQGGAMCFGSYKFTPNSDKKSHDWQQATNSFEKFISNNYLF